MFALGFYFDESYDEPGWSYEFITNDFDEILDTLADAREDEANGVFHWAGAVLMIRVLKNDGSEEWQPLRESNLTLGEMQ